MVHTQTAPLSDHLMTQLCTSMYVVSQHTLSYWLFHLRVHYTISPLFAVQHTAEENGNYFFLVETEVQSHTNLEKDISNQRN